MSRTLLEITVGAALSVMIAGAVLAAGNAGVQTGPRPIQPEVGGPAGCSTAAIEPMAGSGISGNGKLCITDEGVQPSLKAAGLTPGAVYTVWLAYFDRPERCWPGRCTLDALGGDDPAGVIGRMDGIVADGRRQAQFWGDFRDLHLSGGSQVVLQVFGTGPLSTGDNLRRAGQLLTLQPPRLGSPPSGPAANSAPVVPVARVSFDLP